MWGMPEEHLICNKMCILPIIPDIDVEWKIVIFHKIPLAWYSPPQKSLKFSHVHFLIVSWKTNITNCNLNEYIFIFSWTLTVSPHYVCTALFIFTVRNLLISFQHLHFLIFFLSLFSGLQDANQILIFVLWQCLDCGLEVNSHPPARPEV